MIIDDDIMHVMINDDENTQFMIIGNRIMRVTIIDDEIMQVMC
jgi:hypothetical protein